MSTNQIIICIIQILVSGSNLASHMVGSLKKGSKPSSSISLPSSAYNTLPSQHHLRTSTSSPRFIGTHSSTPPTTKPLHKRSPSSDSGTGSNTPVSSYHSNSGGAKTPVHHTVYLHGNCIWIELDFYLPSCDHTFVRYFIEGGLYYSWNPPKELRGMFAFWKIMGKGVITLK